MNKEEYLVLFESFSLTCRRVSEKIEAWKEQCSTPDTCRVNARLPYYFRPESIFVKDALTLYKNAMLFDGKESREMIASLCAILKSVASGCDDLITVPVLKISNGEEALKNWLDLLYKRLCEELQSEGMAPLVFPTQDNDISEFRSEVKNYVHRLALQLIQDKRLKDVLDYPQARDYIVNCTKGSLRYKECKQIQDVMHTLGWKPTSLLTFCKGGSNYSKKTNDKKQGKSSKKKRAVLRGLKGAWHDAVI